MGETASVSEGTTCLLLVMPVISGRGALLLPSAEELEELARAASPRERFLLFRPSLELSSPLTRFPQLPAPFQRDVPLPLSAPEPRRDLPSWLAESPLTLGWSRSPAWRWELSRAPELSPTLGCRWTRLSEGRSKGAWSSPESFPMSGSWCPWWAKCV